MNKLITDDTFIVTGKYVTKQIAMDGDRAIFHKIFSLNELIGTELGKIRHINVCRNFLFKCEEKDDIEIGSYCFKDNACDYLTIKGFRLNEPCENFYGILKYCRDDDNREQLINEMLELFALDTYMMQTDRYYYNLLFERRPDGTLHLAPIYDFGFTFGLKANDGLYMYDSCLKSFVNDKSYKSMFIKYPQFREMIESYVDIDICDYIEDVSNRYRLNDKEIDYKYYRKINKELQKRLKRILK